MQHSPDLFDQLPCLGDDVGPREADNACHLHGVPAGPEKDSHSLGGRWGSPRRVTRGGQEDMEKGASEAGRENHGGTELHAGDTLLPPRPRAGRRSRPPVQQLPQHQMVTRPREPSSMVPSTISCPLHLPDPTLILTSQGKHKPTDVLGFLPDACLTAPKPGLTGRRQAT